MWSLGHFPEQCVNYSLVTTHLFGAILHIIVFFPVKKTTHITQEYKLQAMI